MAQFSPKSIHMIAICGIGMGSLAGLLAQKGFKVSGSDHNIYPPMSDQLQSLGIKLRNGYDPNNITPDVDLVIIGNAVSKDHPEVKEVLRRSLPYLSFPQALHDYFLKEKKPIVITGTHGKTTSSSLVSWILEKSGRAPSFLVGGILKNFGRSFHVGTGEDFIVEGDEYDTAFFDKGPKFLHYPADLAVLTSLEFDHADIYADFEAVEEAFRRFVTGLSPKARLIACFDHPSVRKLALEAPCRVISYGLNPDWDYHPRILKVKTLPLIGEHNLQNILAAVAVARERKISWEKIEVALRSFEGVRRRQEICGVAKGVTLIDDFAHHPTAVEATLSALAKVYANHRLWAVFEPRSNTSQRNIFQDRFAKALSLANPVIVADLFRPEKIPQAERLNPQALVERVRQLGKEAHFIPTVERIVEHVAREARPGDVIVIMSNGGFGQIHEKILNRLEGKREAIPA